MIQGHPFRIYPLEFSYVLGPLSPLLDPLVVEESRRQDLVLELPGFADYGVSSNLLGVLIEAICRAKMPNFELLICQLSDAAMQSREVGLREIQGLIYFCDYFQIECYPQCLTKVIEKALPRATTPLG